MLQNFVISFCGIFLWVLFYLLFLAIKGLPYSVWPQHTTDLFILNGQVFAVYFLVMWCLKIFAVLKIPLTVRPTPQKLLLEFVRNSLRPALACLGFVCLFTVACLGQANVKANIPLANPQINDAWLIRSDLWLVGPWWQWQSEFLLRFPKLVYVWQIFFEFVYSLFGNYITGVFFLLVWKGQYQAAFRQVSCVCYGLLLCVLISLFFPSLGPFKEIPTWFWFLNNSETQKYQEILSLLQQRILQNSKQYQIIIINGISALPSYHVFSWVMSTFFLRVLKGYFFRVGLVFCLLNWVSTCVLGWHYFVDGLVSVILALCLYALYAKIGNRYARP